MSNNELDRAEGSRASAGVKPSAALFSGEQFTPKAEPPVPLGIEGVCAKAAARDLSDATTAQARFMFGFMSYEHVSGYFGLFAKDDASETGTSLMRVHRVIRFDRELQALLIEYIGLFELKFRAQYSYALGVERGAFAHRNRKNFKNGSYFKSFLGEYSKEFSRQLRSKNTRICSSYEKYGDAPIWLAVEIMSFGTLSKLYQNTRSAKVRNSVASSFGVDNETLTSWMRALSSARNQCAHFGNLAGRPLVAQPRLIQGIGYEDNRNPFYIVLVLAKLLSFGCEVFEDEALAYGPSFVLAISALLIKHRDEALTCGVPEDWYQILSSPKIIGNKVRMPESLAAPREGYRIAAFAGE